MVEVNAGRFNGVDFRMLADVCVGYNAFDVALDALIEDRRAWDAVPSLPPEVLRGAGRLVKLVCYHEGVLLQDVEPPDGLDSLINWEPKYSEAGDITQLTVDNGSNAGYAWLLHGDPDVVEKDFETLRRLQTDLFVVG